MARREQHPGDGGLFDYSSYPAPQRQHRHIGRRTLAGVALAVTTLATGAGIAAWHHEYVTGEEYSLGTENGLQKIETPAMDAIAATAVRYSLSPGSGFHRAPIGGGLTEITGDTKTSAASSESVQYDAIIHLGAANQVLDVAFASEARTLMVGSHSYTTEAAFANPQGSDKLSSEAASLDPIPYSEVTTTNGWAAFSKQGTVEIDTIGDSKFSLAAPGSIPDPEATALNAARYVTDNVYPQLPQ